MLRLGPRKSGAPAFCVDFSLILPMFGSRCRALWVMISMTELNKMEDAEDQAFLEDVDTLQTDEEHAQNLLTLKEQKEKRIKCVQGGWGAQPRFILIANTKPVGPTQAGFWGVKAKHPIVGSR